MKAENKKKWILDATSDYKKHSGTNALALRGKGILIYTDNFKQI